MVVQHNMTAMNANRQLGITQNAQAKSSENYLQVIELTVQEMMLLVYLFLRK